MHVSFFKYYYNYILFTNLFAKWRIFIITIILLQIQIEDIYITHRLKGPVTHGKMLLNLIQAQVVITIKYLLKETYTK